MGDQLSPMAAIRFGVLLSILLWAIVLLTHYWA